MALSSSSEPFSMASSRRSREYQVRILLAARWVTTNFSQSRDGPEPPTLEVKISTESPDSSSESSGTRRPLTRAPMHVWPTSVWMA